MIKSDRHTDRPSDSFSGLSVSLVRFLFTVFLIYFTGCVTDKPEWVPAKSPDGWKIGNFADAGFEAAALTKLTLDISAGKFPNTHALLIEHNSNLIYEHYFAGTDEEWGEQLGHRLMGKDSLHDLRSISKSVTSVLLGIALGKKFEEALSKPVISYFPEIKSNPDLEKVNLYHVLTMTAGIEWNEMTIPYTDPENDEIRMYSVSDPVAWVLSKSLVCTPGEHWYYSGGLSQVLAGVIQQITDRPLATYANQVLFQPLAITGFEWPAEPLWDPAMPSAASGLRLRARDLAKIGSLYLHGGRWHGRQIVPEAWVNRSIERLVDVLPGGWDMDGIYGYGFQWWIGRLPEGNDFIAGVGNGNQRLFIIPEKKLVVTILAGEYNKFEGHSERLLRSIIALAK